MKDHEKRELVSELVGIASIAHGTEQLRDRIAYALSGVFSAIDGVTGRAEKAEAELAMLANQEPVTFVIDFNGYAIDGKHTEIANALPTGMDLYAAPVPAVAAPAVPEEFFVWVAAYGDYIEKLDAYNKKLTISRSLPFPGLDMNDEFQAFTAAQNKAHRMLPDLYKKARTLLQSAPQSEVRHD